MTDRQSTERSIFLNALDQPFGPPRDAWVAEACGEDGELRQQVLALLAGHEQTGDLLERVDTDPDATVQTPALANLVGETIGPYKLREQLGEGGFGVVYVAEQTEPVRRKVALKVIKPGMDTKEIIARFEAERQALALMDHPHIAKVLDAGATEQGRPYFVMELVKGVPVTRFCDEARLDTRQRLELFIKVCQAVQHAHQKGIIHRDIKPSNVLVTLHDGVPVPKVIDFGVAKALNQRLTDQTVYTHVAQMVGTPLYMSPEQAEYSGLDIDTRTDIYSLGVLLYELLTGTTPFDREAIKRAGFDELRRIIREDEPPRPSARISTLAGDLRSTVCDRRKVDSRRLSQSLRGDLDWIVMRTLEKDRNRRYETANALVRDIERYLANEPVEACPPSVVYRLRKFARRNRLAFSTIAATIAVLLVGVVGLSVANARIAEEHTKAEDALQESRENFQLAQTRADEAEAARKEAEGERQNAEQNLESAMDAVDRLLAHVSNPELGEIPRVQAVRRAMLADAIRFYEAFSEQNGTSPQLRIRATQAWFSIAALQELLGEVESAESAFMKALSMADRLVQEAPEDRERLRLLQRILHNGAWFRLDVTNDFQGAEQFFRRSVDVCEQLDSDAVAHALALRGLGTAMVWNGSPAEGVEQMHKAIRLLESCDGPIDYPLGATWAALTTALDSLDPDEAVHASFEAIEHFRIALEHEQTPTHHLQWALYFQLDNAARHLESDDPEQALALIAEAVSGLEGLANRFPNFPAYVKQLHAATNLQVSLRERRLKGLLPESDTSGAEIDTILNDMRETAQRMDALMSDNSDHDGFVEVAITARRGLADAYALLGREEDALQQFDQLVRIAEEALAEHDESLAAEHENLAAQKAYAEFISDYLDPDDAIERYTELIARYPDVSTFYRYRGAVLRGLGRTEEALKDLNKAVELLPPNGDPRTYESRGIVLATDLTNRPSSPLPIDFWPQFHAAGAICRFMYRGSDSTIRKWDMSDRTKQKSDEEQLIAAAMFIKKVGGVEKAKQALEELKKLRKAG